jgi:F-box protein 42
MDQNITLIESLPDEVLEFILSRVSQYGDLKACGLTCRRWNSCSKNVVRKKQADFARSVQEMQMNWSACTNATTAVINDNHHSTAHGIGINSTQTDKPKVLVVGKRYSHSAVYDDTTDSMYIFGGCTSTATTFNDLWRLDLTTRRWYRPLATGTYPSPKACSVLVKYGKKLILFGGWTHPSMYPLHRWRLFNELHSYDLETSTWTQLLTPAQAGNVEAEDILRPPTMAGHSATIHRGRLIVFGGLQKQRNSIGQFSSSSDVWSFDLESLNWMQEDIPEPRPTARYGQSQLYLDEKHLLILGGCGGPSNIFNDVWLLTMGQSTNADNSPWTSVHWKWDKCRVENSLHGANHMWCHPAVKVGDFAVMMGKNRLPKQQSSKVSQSTEHNKRQLTGHRGEQGVSSRNQHEQARWNVIPQLRRGVNRGYGAIRRPHTNPSSQRLSQNIDRAEMVSNANAMQLDEIRVNNVSEENNDSLSNTQNEAMSTSDEEQESEISVVPMENLNNSEQERLRNENTSHSDPIFRSCVTLNINSDSDIENKDAKSSETHQCQPRSTNTENMDISTNTYVTGKSQTNSNISESMSSHNIQTKHSTKDSVRSNSKSFVANSSSQNQLQAPSTSNELNQNLSAQSNCFKTPLCSKQKTNNQVVEQGNCNVAVSNEAINHNSQQHYYRSSEDLTPRDTLDPPCSSKNPVTNNSSLKLKPHTSSSPKVSAISFNKTINGQLGAGMMFNYIFKRAV